MSDSSEYKLRWRGREAGPFSVPEINRQLDEHEIGMGHEIYCDGQWMTLEEFFRPPPPPEPANPAPAPPVPVRITPAPPQQKASSSWISVSVGKEPTELTPYEIVPANRPRHRMVFALLAIVAGFVGAHNFYARQWLTGLLQLLLTIATYLMGFGIIASWLWAIVEAILVRKDGDGIEMI